MVIQSQAPTQCYLCVTKNCDAGTGGRISNITYSFIVSPNERRVSPNTILFKIEQNGFCPRNTLEMLGNVTVNFGLSFGRTKEITSINVNIPPTITSSKLAEMITSLVWKDLHDIKDGEYAMNDVRTAVQKGVKITGIIEPRNEFATMELCPQ